MKKAVFIVGPTGVGKTKLAEKISKVIPSVLISADSVQVYKGLDIISGKDHSPQTKLHLIDVVSPDEDFSVKDYVVRVESLIALSKKEKKLPVIVGGTGFYLRALFSPIETLEIPTNQDLRSELDKKTVEELQERLKEADEVRLRSMNESDIRNKRRLVRAIEIAGAKTKSRKPIFNEDEILFIGLKLPKEKLKKIIEARAKKRVEKGALAEAKTLYDKYDSLSSQVKNAVGYRELFEHLKGNLTFDEALEKWVQSEMKIVKKQMTWFKTENIEWFSPEKEAFDEAISRIARGISPN